MWGIVVVIPLLRPLAIALHQHFDWIPFFNTKFLGPSVISAGIVLAIMILPTIASIARDALAAVPNALRDGALSLGATKWETILKVILPTALPGLFAALVLGLGRALGETMAVTMLVGNKPNWSLSLLGSADTLTTLMANNFAEAGDSLPVFMFAALVLMAITLAVNALGSLLVARASTTWVNS
jgi:phosphate transport system permease protein